MNETAIEAPPAAESPETRRVGNPYVGPAAFKEGRRLYGRERELRELTALLLAEGAVLLHSPSGAGKTSLIQSGLMPSFRNLCYQVLPLLRVGLQQPEPAPRGNRYLASTMLSLDVARPAWAVENLTGSARQASLQAYLEELRDLNDQHYAPQMLLFDQFEEILTLDPTDIEEKREFFTELGTALRNSNCAVLFAVREEWLGDLEPYLALLNIRSLARYRLELLRPEAAEEAIVEPARSRGVAYAPKAFEKLMQGLGEEKVRTSSGRTEPRKGPFIEPVELQVVCRRIWHRFASENDLDSPGAKRVIDEADIEKAGSIGAILQVFYSDTVAAVAESTGTEERTIREWIADHLIAPGGIRNQVLEGQDYTEGLSNEVLEALANARIVRAEHHGGRMWYEITHDSLVEPIRDSNQRWDAEHATWLLRKARIWEATDQKPQALLSARQVLQYYLRRTFRRTPEAPLTEPENKFLRLSRGRFGRRAFVAFAIYVGIAGLGLWKLSDYWDDRAFRTYGTMIFELENELYFRTTDEVLYSPRTGTPPGDRNAFIGREVSEAYLAAQRREAFAELHRMASIANPAAVRQVSFRGASSEPTLQALRRIGFNVVPSSTGNAIPNAITFGDSVPLDQVRFVAMQLIANGHFPKRLRRSRGDARLREIQIHYEEHVVTWAPVPVADIMRMEPAPPMQ
jgi:hypothetical protein